MMNSIGDYLPDDISIVKRQLQVNNVSIAGIVERCPHGFPAVIIINPAVSIGKGDIGEANYSMLSNILWLTCPYVNKQIHDLESKGYVRKMGDFISNDRALSLLMNNAHAHYHFLRKNIFTRFFNSGETVPKNVSDIFQTGIGGIKNSEYLKCLHVHYAHYKLCPDNVAGKIVCHLLEGKTVCSEVLCAAGG